MLPSDDFEQIKSALPRLGVGLGLRRSIFKETLQAQSVIDWLEIVPENYMGKGGRSYEMLEEAKDQGFPIISHGVALSIGSLDDLDASYLAQIKDLFKVIQPAWFSDHLCFTSYNNVHFQDLIPLPLTWEAVHHVVNKIQAFQAHFDRPFLIENVSYYCDFAQPELTEAQFLTEVLERANCGLMLDVNNVYVNARNHGFDPYQFLDQLPLHRAVQIHMAGHFEKDTYIVDTHGEPIRPEVFDLLDYVLPKTDIHGILLERDQNIPALPELLDELETIRTIYQKHHPMKVLRNPLVDPTQERELVLA